MTTRSMVFLASLSILAWELAAPSRSEAATLRVCATGSASFTSIAKAVTAAATGDIIDLCAGIHTEFGIRIDKAITLRGAGAAATIVQAAPTNSAAGARVLEIDLTSLTRGTVTVRDLTIRNGRAIAAVPPHGGGVLVRGAGTAARASIERCVISGSTASLGGGVAAIGNAVVAVLESQITDNDTAAVPGIDYPSGGGLACVSCQATLIDTTVRGNTAQIGGGIAVFEGDLQLRRSAVHDNLATERGGGLYLYGNVVLINSTVSQNAAPADAGLALILDSAIGGGRSEIVHGTIASNGDTTGTGLVVHAGSIAVANTVISGHGAGDCLLVGSLELQPGVPNLDSDGTCVGFSVSHADAALGPLADNGGPTWTHALLDASAALDVGWNEICRGALAGGEDQRGNRRPPTGGCDLGAFERRN